MPNNLERLHFKPNVIMKNLNTSPRYGWLKFIAVLPLAVLCLITSLQAQRSPAGANPARAVNKVDSAYVRNNYKKMEIMVPMRDGAKLFTSIYMPKDSTKSYPIMMSRSPYGSAPYGAEYKTAIGPSALFMREGFIFVYQDARGRFLSEGDFTATRPHIANKKSNKDVDESS